MSILSVRGEQSTSAEIAKLTELNNLGDPNADRIIFWDDSEDSLALLTIGSGLTLTGTTLTGDAGSLTGVGSVNQIAYWTDSAILGALPITTYPSLTELSYVKGVTSAIQTQIDTKGTGTVTSVSVTTANGVSGTVATATTTPAITLTLGSITPSAVQISGLTASEIVITDASKNLASAAVATYPSLTELSYVKGVTSAVQTQFGTKASTALDNLASVAINTTLVSDTDNTDALGTTAIAWSDLFLGSGAVITFNSAPSTADITITHAPDTLTFAGGTIALGTATATGGLTGNVTGDVTGNAGTVTVADAGGDTTTFPLLGTDATGSLSPRTDAGLTYNATSNRLGVTGGAELGTAVATIGADATLDVFGTTNAIIHGHNSGAQSTTGGAAIIAYAVPGAAMTTGNRLSAFVGGGDVDASHTLANATAITSFATENWSGTQNGANMKFEVTANGATTRSVALTLGQDLSATFAGNIELGNADTTLSRVSAGVVAIEGVNILTTAGGTLTGTINLGEGADPATIGIVMDSSMSADERYSGITVPGTAGATLAFGDICYLDVTATEWLLADASAASTAGDVVLGICVDASTDGNATSMLLIGTVRSAAFPGSIALGAPLYVSETAGDITATAPTTTDSVMRRVGFAVTAEPNTIYFNPSTDYITHT